MSDAVPADVSVEVSPAAAEPTPAADSSPVVDDTQPSQPVSPPAEASVDPSPSSPPNAEPSQPADPPADAPTPEADGPTPPPESTPPPADDDTASTAEGDDDPEPPLVEADDSIPSPHSEAQPTDPAEGGAVDEAEAELQRYDELVKAAGQQTQELILDNANEEPIPVLFSPSHAPLSSRPRPLPSAPTSARAGPFVPSSARGPAAVSPEPLSPTASSPPSPTSLTSSLDADRAECDLLLSINKQRQRQIALFLEAQHRHGALQGGAHPPGTAGAEGAAADPIKTDYIKLLTQIHGLWEELASQQAQAEAQVSSLIAQLNSQDQKGEALASSLHAFQVEIARTAVDRHGSPLNLKALERLHGEEVALSKALADVRLHYLTQQAKVDALQAGIKEKEELAEGLHLIDFEQLKIENATLHEKVEERQDELYKLTKKKNTAVEVLTHVREKVWFVWEENEGLRQQVQDEERGIQEKRAAMKALKTQREALRRENEQLKVKEGFVGLDALVVDYERRKEEVKRLQEEVHQRQEVYDRIKSGGPRRAGPGGKAGRQEEQKEQIVGGGQGRRALTPTLTIRR